MAKYEIWQTSGDLKGLVKTYPFKIQAVIWCMLHGFVYSGFEDFQNKRFYVLDEHIEIRRV